MSEALSIQCPKCQSTNLKTVRLSDQIGTAVFWTVVGTFFMMLGGVFGPWGFVYFLLGAAAVVAFVVVPTWVAFMFIPCPTKFVCKECGTR